MPTQISLEISASAVAWYGAVVATLSFAIAAWNAWSDRAHVLIKFQRDMQVVGEGPYPKDKTVAIVNVVNRGKRPVNITRAGIRMVGRDRKFMILTDSLLSHGGRVLTEESPTTDFIVEQDLIPFGNVWYVTVYDATGREYRKYMTRFPMMWRVWFWLRHRK